MRIKCSVCGQNYEEEDMILILGEDKVCRFCNENEVIIKWK
jgi:hypothetical protein